MATFNPTVRVKVTDQSSAYRDKFGVVESRDGENHQVRLDGHPVGRTVLLLGKQLQSTTISNPIDYSNSVS